MCSIMLIRYSFMIINERTRDTVIPEARFGGLWAKFVRKVCEKSLIKNFCYGVSVDTYLVYRWTGWGSVHVLQKVPCCSEVVFFVSQLCFLFSISFLKKLLCIKKKTLTKYSSRSFYLKKLITHTCSCHFTVTAALSWNPVSRAHMPNAGEFNHTRMTN